MIRSVAGLAVMTKSAQNDQEGRGGMPEPQTDDDGSIPNRKRDERAPSSRATSSMSVEPQHRLGAAQDDETKLGPDDLDQDDEDAVASMLSTSSMPQSAREAIEAVRRSLAQGRKALDEAEAVAFAPRTGARRQPIILDKDEPQHTGGDSAGDPGFQPDAQEFSQALRRLKSVSNKGAGEAENFAFLEADEREGFTGISDELHGSSEPVRGYSGNNAADDDRLDDWGESGRLTEEPQLQARFSMTDPLELHDNAVNSTQTHQSRDLTPSSVASRQSARHRNLSTVRASELKWNILARPLEATSRAFGLLSGIAYEDRYATPLRRLLALREASAFLTMSGFLINPDDVLRYMVDPSGQHLDNGPAQAVAIYQQLCREEAVEPGTQISIDRLLAISVHVGDLRSLPNIDRQPLLVWQGEPMDPDLPGLVRAVLKIEEGIRVFGEYGDGLRPFLASSCLASEAVTPSFLAFASIGHRALRTKWSAIDPRHPERGIVAWLAALSEGALQTVSLFRRIGQVDQDWQRRLGQRRSTSRLPLLARTLLEDPVLTSSLVTERLRQAGVTGVSEWGARKMLSELEELGILSEATGRASFRIWIARAVLD